MADGPAPHKDLSNEFDASARFFIILAPGGKNSGFHDPKNLKRITDHFEKLGLKAEFLLAKNGLPAQDEFGSYTLVTRDAEAEKQAPRILDFEYGLMPVPTGPRPR